MNTRKTGAEYEQIAAEYLQEKGYHILERNFRCRYGEIDLIAEQGETLVYVEIKYRGSMRCGNPLEAVDSKKRAASVKLRCITTPITAMKRSVRADLM